MAPMGVRGQPYIPGYIWVAGVVAATEWAEVDLRDATWTILGAELKMRDAHRVPVPRQIVALLRGLPGYTEGGRHVFVTLARQ